MLSTNNAPPPPHAYDSATSTLETLVSANKKSEAEGGVDGLLSMDSSLNSQLRKDIVKSEQCDSVSKEKKKKRRHKQHRGMWGISSAGLAVSSIFVGMARLHWF